MPSSEPLVPASGEVLLDPLGASVVFGADFGVLVGAAWVCGALEPGAVRELFTPGRCAGAAGAVVVVVGEVVCAGVGDPAGAGAAGVDGAVVVVGAGSCGAGAAAGESGARDRGAARVGAGRGAPTPDHNQPGGDEQPTRARRDIQPDRLPPPVGQRQLLIDHMPSSMCLDTH
ncbi:hypothetical protein [Nocardia cyriacigeorgica]|uniref:hypothetical protein n=1 Tax=Nocardia cyriacigeorgica TaxID=135487 RepID=UPI002457A715|nr:hypothetical protein [Nocardia cyriacigeorgica]